MGEIVKGPGQTIVRPGADIVASMAEGFQENLFTTMRRNRRFTIEAAG